MSRIIRCGADFQFEVRVSDVDYDWLMRRGKWLVTHPGKGREEKRYAYQCFRQGRRDGKPGRQIMIWMHKVILLRSVGPPPTPAHIIGDHIDGDTFDDRRHMLRWATPKMNSENKFGWHYKQPSLLDLITPEVTDASVGEGTDRDWEPQEEVPSLRDPLRPPRLRRNGCWRRQYWEMVGARCAAESVRSEGLDGRDTGEARPLPVPYEEAR